MLKKIFIALPILLVIAGAIAAIILYPYFKMPPEPKEALDAKLSEYQNILKEASNRPKQDREALDAITLEMKQSIGKQKLSMEKCPPYTEEFLKVKRLIIDKISAYEDRFAAILDGGLVIQIDGHLLSELPTFDSIHVYINQQFALAVISNKAGEKEKMMNHLGNAVQLIQALEQVPHLIFLMTGSSMEARLYETIVFLLPSLDEVQIKTLQKMVSGLPNGRKLLIEAIKADVASTVEFLDHIGKGTEVPGYNMGAEPEIDKIFDSFSLISESNWYYTRERYTFLSLATGSIEAMEGWLAAGGKGDPPSVIQNKIKYSLVALLAWPNTPRLMNKMTEKMHERSALLEAMDAELNRRTSDPRPDIDIPIKGGAKIVLKSEYGCIVKNEVAKVAK